ncbi:MAG: DedA family protein [Candidatus Adiutrix sp.]|jgi:membrane-associated protein|nr:DedA family protein [Candidatus Adiutrix sp.]
MPEILSAFADFILDFIDFIIHIDVHLTEIVGNYGWQTYLILFIIVFWETGVVIWPFLPGDSLLFAAGSISALDSSPLDPWLLFFILSAAAILGDTVNYWAGRWAGPRAFKGDGRFLKKKYLDKTRFFYEKYGARTIIIARFVPIVRTFAPFVAGVGQMRYRRFLTYNLVGALLWNCLFISAGYFFGNLNLVKNNFSLVILAIIFLSCLPMIIEYIRLKTGRTDSSNKILDKGA